MNGAMLESALLQTHFDVIPFGIYVVDVASHELVFVNRHFRETLGAVEGRKCYEVIFAEEAPCLHCRIAELVTADGRPNGETVVYDLFNEREDRWYQMQEKTMGWPDGRVVKYAIAVDISELKETQNRLAEAHAELAIRNKDLADQNRILQENMALREHVERIARHDLKAPLSALIGLPQILLDNFDLPEDALAVVRLIEQAGHSMLEMLNQSLVLYRLETGTYVLAPHDLDLVDLLRRGCTRLQTMSVARGRRLVLRRHGLPVGQGDRLPYSGDEQLLETMVQNLVVNALEASPEGGEIVLDVRDAPGRVILAIANDGEVPPDIRPRMFEKYVTKGKRGGTGLGAYSAALAARAHGGRLALDAVTIGRTTVLVSLPRRIGDAA